MPSTARRSLLLAIVVTGILAFVVGRASGGSPLDGATSQLHSPAALGGAPSVSVPSVPHVSVPSVPHVTVPSVPHVSVPSVPSTPSAAPVPRSVRAPGLPSAGGSARSVGRGAPAAASGNGAAGSGSGSSGAGAARGANGSSASRGAPSRAHAASAGERRHASADRERRLRRDVGRFAGCLGALPDAEGRLLALRAGLDRPAPASRADVARLLGISTERAAQLERRGLKALREAGRAGVCGSGAGGRGHSAALAAQAGSGPQLQPAVLLTPRPALTSPAELARPHRQAGGGSGSAGASAGESGRSGVRPTGVVHGVEASSDTARYVVGSAILALLLATFLVAWRRRDRGAPVALADQTGTAVVWRPPAESDGPEAPAPAEAAAPVADEPQAGPTPAEAAAPVADETQAGPTPAEDVAPVANELSAAPIGTEEPAPDAAPPAAAPHGARSRPAAVAAATLVSLGVALLGRWRRRR